MFAVAFAVAVPGSTQVLYSTGKRASAALLSTMLTFVEMVPRVTVKKKNQEELFFCVDSGPVARIFSYPSNPRVSTFHSIHIPHMPGGENSDWHLHKGPLPAG